MNMRERILAALSHRTVDCIAWAPRWDLWFNAARKDGRLPERYRDWEIHDVARALGMGLKGYGVRLYREETYGIGSAERVAGGERVQEYETPYGTLRRVEQDTSELAAAGVRGRVVRHLVEEVSDYDAAMYLVEHTRLIPQHEEVAAELEKVGGDGVVLGFVGHAPAHHVMREFTGYEGFYYQLHDNASRLQRLIDALDERQRTIEKIAVESPARVIEFDGNYDAMLTPPPIYERFFLPAHEKLVRACHRAGKLVATHTDGHNDGLMGLIMASGFDVAEAFTSPPMTNIGVAEARQTWGNRVAIWGGLASIVFTPRYSDAEFDAHVWQVLEEAESGCGFVLGTGDNVPTDGSLDRIRRVGALLEMWHRDKQRPGR